MKVNYSKDYEVNYYDVDYSLNCTVSKLLGMFADIGNRHMEELGCSVEELLNEGMTWVYYNYKIDVKRYPKFGEKITLNTVAEWFKKFYAKRSYEIKDEMGNVIVSGESIFVMLDLEKRKVIRIPKSQYEVFKVEKDTKETFTLPRLKDIDEVNFNEEFKVRYSDIDVNKHVNNTKYVEWSLETIPENILFGYNLKSLNVIFEKECKYGENINVYTKITELEDGNIKAEHRIENENNECLTKLEGNWTKK